MRDSILLEYVEQKVSYNGEVNRAEFLCHMEYLKAAFPDNNAVSTKLVELIPNIVSIKIDKDANDTQDIPYIWYVTMTETNMLKIRRHHSIIWGFLNRFCYEVKLNQ